MMLMTTRAQCAGDTIGMRGGVALCRSSSISVRTIALRQRSVDGAVQVVEGLGA